MRPAEKVKATIAAAGLKYEEFCELCGVSRQILHHYFKPEVHMDDFDKGVKCIAVSKKLWALCEDKTLPLTAPMTSEEKVSLLREMLKRGRVEVQS